MLGINLSGGGVCAGLPSGMLLGTCYQGAGRSVLRIIAASFIYGYHMKVQARPKVIVHSAAYRLVHYASARK